MGGLMPKEQKQMQVAFESAEKALGFGYEMINKSYLTQLDASQIKPLIIYDEVRINPSMNIRIFRIERIVVENKQSVLESLAAAYTALGAAGHSVFLYLDGNGYKTTVHLGVRARAGVLGGTAGNLLCKAFQGHFSGSRLSELPSAELRSILNKVNPEAKEGYQAAVTAVTGVPSLSVEDREHFMQGIEHFLDAAEGREYQALILGEPVSNASLDQIRLGYESVATQISPLLKQSISYGENESASIGYNITESISKSLADSIGMTETSGTTESQTKSTAYTTNESTTHGTNESTSGKTGVGKVGTLLLAGAGAAAGVALAPLTGGASLAVTSAGLAAAAGAGLGMGAGSAIFDTKTKGSSTSTTTGTSVSKTDSLSYGTSQSTARSNTQTFTDTQSTTAGQNTNQTVGSSKQITIESVNKHIEQLLKKIDQQLERVEEARRYGAWQTAAYFIAEDSASSASMASLFLGLMRGNNSNSEDFALTTWGFEESKKILPWLANLTHPRLSLEMSKQLGIDFLTPAALVSGKEMAIQLSLPRRSTSAVSVVETQAFGRRVQNVNGGDNLGGRAVNLGVVRHLWTDYSKQAVRLDLDQLSGHVFVTGSTGSGKSNTVYQLLTEALKHRVNFMVIEPAKGEYKHIFGQRSDVLVLGTNPTQAQLLKINPFKFPDGVHVLEHIDRLVEIFNVCWPMYAAMPAVLKDAMLTAYEQAGWDLDASINSYAEDLFPSFIDLLKALEEVIEQSAFSQEVKSNYIGSLVTRVKSLTNGLNGQIFASNEIDNQILFDGNIIIDLSRVGSQETKSLIMGILVMRLSEYRMSSSGMNQSLKHITVLEEAHNILKKTSTEQSSEGSNVAGKAVEMLSNAIAEMRTYGEGFIIADQSPTSVDISAIKNTNTKIIMRLPEENDRRLAGKAAGVTDEQIDELARLPKGVAVVYQNDWLEPVLCKINRCHYEELQYQYSRENEAEITYKQFNLHLAQLLMHKQIQQLEAFDLDILERGMNMFSMPVKYKIALKTTIEQVKQGQTPTIWQNKIDVENLLFSILNIRTQVLRLIQESDDQQSLEWSMDQLMRKHIDDHDVLFRKFNHSVFETWQQYKKDVV